VTPSESILLFDPDADSAEMYSVGLKLAGFRACVARNPAEALDILRDENPAAAVVDLGLTAGAGWDLIRVVRHTPVTRDLPVVLLTGRADFSTSRRAAELGCAALLLKPCLPDTLSDVVRQSLDLNS
jgi:two-component system C4-dicarboxylate transport response regulator DctD